ncbi:DUF4129 domain-containing protein (plasmid) [Halorarum halophilum]|uniref:DUF4129 domain-containing protein n=1 Tax=Halorarum halophilum TaxID=2743090 RepID=A0A7D5GEE1_9EURY|nr:DUF4129 domain-containing protein [Halobaculum halophilum]QLG29732.1 DUF4129 domain-containing protein [Halobaculum halophilum]
MTGEQVLTAALALCCLFALGTSAATLDASVDTTPDDVITFDQASLPLPSDEVGSLKEQIQSDPEDPQSEERSSSSSSDSSDRESGGSSDDNSAESGSSDQSGDQSASVQNGGEGATDDEPDLLDRLLALLLALLDLLVSLLPVFLVVGAVAAAARHPRRLEALLTAVLERFGLARNGDGGDAGTLLVPSPTNDVERAWYEMVQRLDLDDELAATPGEVAGAAVDAGVDREVVEGITRPFEEVRYGGAPVTEERRARAQEALERFRAQIRDGGNR